MYYIIIMVIAMTINIITEPEYKDTVWCRETLCGIEKKAASLRYKTKICSFDMLSADMENIIIVGTSPGYVASILGKTTLLGIRAIAISCQPVETKEKTSYVLIDHNRATKECIEYLQSCGRKSIALYGINRNSYADMIKTKYFDDKNIYYSAGKNAMQDCYEIFVNQVSYYNAVVCSNYISAIYLMNRLKSAGICVPKDLYVVAYGDSVIGNIFSPSLTTITLNHEQLGIQAVNLCRFPATLSENISVTVSVPCEIHVAKSTDNIPYVKSVNNFMQTDISDNIFMQDEQLLEIQSLEKMLRMRDDIDFKIIGGLLDGKSYTKIGDALYISESSVKYRIKRLLTGSGIESTAKMLEVYIKYIGGQNE